MSVISGAFMKTILPLRLDSRAALTSFVGATTLALAVTLGCGRSEAASNARAVAAPSAGAHAEADAYTADIAPAGACVHGADCSVVVTLTAKPGYHINAQYPYKFKLADAPSGVSYVKPVIQRADGTFDEKKGSLPVPFKAANPGKVTIVGTLSLSVCSDATCVIEKPELSVDVNVN